MVEEDKIKEIDLQLEVLLSDYYFVLLNCICYMIFVGNFGGNRGAKGGNVGKFQKNKPKQ